MDKTRPDFLLWITTLFSLAFAALPPQEALAQNRALPSAKFNTYSTGGGPLPSAGGLHLQEGQERPRGAPPGVYNPGEPTQGYKLVRWESRFMPLKVWIAPGKRLNEEPISVINAQRPQEVLQLLRADPSLSSLPQCRGWDAEMNAAAKAGIEQWKEFQNEGLFSFVFVDDPAVANIFLFWTERFTGDEGAGGVSTGGNTVAVLYDANEVHKREASIGQRLQGTPVIMELQVQGDSYEKLQARVAHEFGHALGIKEHSPYNEDLMCVNGIAKYLSPSDKATIRWLYHQQPQFVMLPPLVPRNVAPPVAVQAPDESGAVNGNMGDGQVPAHPAGGYRVHINRPSRTIEDRSTGDNSAGGSAAFGTSQTAPRPEPRAREDLSVRGKTLPAGAREEREEDAREAKKSKERKSKHHKDADDSAPASASPAPAVQSTPAPPPAKATDGY